MSSSASPSRSASLRPVRLLAFGAAAAIVAPFLVQDAVDPSLKAVDLVLAALLCLGALLPERGGLPLLFGANGYVLGVSGVAVVVQSMGGSAPDPWSILGSALAAAGLFLLVRRFAAQRKAQL